MQKGVELSVRKCIVVVSLGHAVDCGNVPAL